MRAVPHRLHQGGRHNIDGDVPGSEIETAERLTNAWGCDRRGSEGHESTQALALSREPQLPPPQPANRCRGDQPPHSECHDGKADLLPETVRGSWGKAAGNENCDAPRRIRRTEPTRSYLVLAAPELVKEGLPARRKGPGIPLSVGVKVLASSVRLVAQ